MLFEVENLAREHTCPVCGKEFSTASWQTGWVYGAPRGKKGCADSCMRKYEANQKTRKYVRHGVKK